MLDDDSGELIYCNGIDHTIGINICTGCPDWLYLVKLWRTGNWHESEESDQEIKITPFKILAF